MTKFWKFNLLCFWFYSRLGEVGWVQDSIFLFLMLIKGTRRQGEFKISLYDVTDGEIPLRFSAIFSVLWKQQRRVLDPGKHPKQSHYVKKIYRI